MGVLIVAVVMVVVLALIICTFSSKEHRYDQGFKKGRSDCKKKRQNKYEKLIADRKNGVVLNDYNKAYIDGYNTEMN